MKRIVECKISLMEKEKDFSIDDKGKGNYIIRSSGIFNPENYLKGEDFEEIIEPDEYMGFIENAISLVYDNLIIESKDQVKDAVGLWITFDDGEKIDNAMDISVLEAIENYGEEGVNSILEFAKMTLQPYYESEVSL